MNRKELIDVLATKNGSTKILHMNVLTFLFLVVKLTCFVH